MKYILAIVTFAVLGGTAVASAPNLVSQPVIQPGITGLQDATTNPLQGGSYWGQ